MKSYIALLLVILMLVVGCSSKASMEPLVLGDLEVSDHQVGEGYVEVSHGLDAKKTGLIDLEGNLVLPLEERAITTIHEGMALVQLNHSYRYVDLETGDMLEKPFGQDMMYSDIFIDGYAVVMLKDSTGNFVIDREGHIVLAPTDNRYYYRNMHYGMFEAYHEMTASESQGVYNAQGDLVGLFDYMLIDQGNKHAGFYSSEWDTYGVLNNSNYSPVTKMIYHTFTPFSNNRSLVTLKDGTVHIIDNEGRVIANLSEKYHHIDCEKLHAFQDGLSLLTLTEDERVILINEDGEQIKTIDCDQGYAYNDEIALVKKGEKYGYVNKNGDFLFRPQFDEATQVYQGKGLVLKENVWYVITFEQN